MSGHDDIAISNDRDRELSERAQDVSNEKEGGSQGFLGTDSAPSGLEVIGSGSALLFARWQVRELRFAKRQAALWIAPFGCCKVGIWRKGR